MFQQILKRIDWLLVLFILPILAAGLVTMKSFVPTDGVGDFASKQIIWIAICFSVFLLFSFIDFGFLKQAGAWYSYESVDHDTREQRIHKFLAKDFKKLVNEVPGMKETIYDQICSAYIMKYNTTGEFDIDTILREDIELQED